MELVLYFHHIYKLSNSQLNLTLEKASKFVRTAPTRDNVKRLEGLRQL